MKFTRKQPNSWQSGDLRKIWLNNFRTSRWKHLESLNFFFFINSSLLHQLKNQVQKENESDEILEETSKQLTHQEIYKRFGLKSAVLYNVSIFDV